MAGASMSSSSGSLYSLAIGRSSSRVGRLCPDSRRERVLPASAALSRDGVSPGEVLSECRKEVRRSGGTVTSGEVVAARTSAHGFDVVWEMDGRRRPGAC